jgi:glycosyltransferase involved in cell wall biosynthesis
VVERDLLPPQPRSTRIKVLHVITRFWAGAGGNTLLSAVGMDPERYDVWVAGSPGGPLWERADREGVRTAQLGRFREVLSPVDDAYVLQQLVRLIQRERFTIVHTHSAKGGFLGRLAAQMCGTPVVLHTFHGFSFHDFMGAPRRRAYLALERMVAPMAHRFIAVAPQVAREAVMMKLARPGMVSVVPSAVELESIPTRQSLSVRQELAVPKDATIVGTVGRIDLQKAPLDFVRMAAIVARVRPDIRFVMVGDGPLLEDVKDEARRLGVEILLTGFRPDAPAVAATFDVYVNSSLYEGLGRGLTEALASARPVVATAVNGVPDLVEPGSTGLLASPADPEALAAGVLWLLDHPDEARRMGEQGSARVRSLFDPASMCAAIDEIYSGLLGLQPSHPRRSDLDLSDDRFLDIAAGASVGQSS